MAQPGSDQAVLKARVAVDLGTTSTHVAVCVTDPANPAGFVDEYLLPFGSSADADRSKLTTELDTTIVFSEDGQDCLFGLDGLTRSGIFAFTDWKMGALGEKPFAQILANTCKALETSAPQLKPFGPATLFRRLFMYILKTAREHLRNKYGCAFDTIQCHLTYPVSCSESLRLLLLQEASAAGLDVTGAVSEPMSIAHALNTVKNLSLPPGARLIVDFGGATVDAAVVYEDDNGHLVQACPTKGNKCGGQTVSYRAREWLKKKCPEWTALHNDRSWIQGGISSQIDRCKRAFNGRSDQVVLDGSGNEVTIPASEMANFFRPLLTGGVNLTKSMCDTARTAGHRIVTVVASGGVVGNDSFVEEFFKQLRSETDIQTFEKVQEPGIVALGALSYARDPNPLVEHCVITRHLGLDYVGDYTRNGERPLGKGKLWHGIGWMLLEGQDPTRLPGHIRFTKKIPPGSTDIEDRLIESNIYVAPAGSETFSSEYIRQNNLIEWDCNITYPTTDKILSHLSHLGTFSGILDHEELFPPGTKAKEAELEFQLTLKVDRQLLRGEFSYVRDGQLIPLKDVRYTPLPLRPWSEYANEKLSSDYYLEGPAGSEGPQSISEQKGPAPTTISVSPSSTGSPDLPVANQSSFSAGTVYSDPIPTGSVDIAASVDFVADLLRRQHENQSSRPYYVRKATRTSPPRRSPRAISVVSKSVSDLQGPNLDW